LIKEGLMAPPGLKRIEEAKANGRWDNPSVIKYAPPPSFINPFCKIFSLY
jgi:hypothetical protein